MWKNRIQNRDEIDQDDGRTVINMNVDGMPWFRDQNTEISQVPSTESKSNRLPSSNGMERVFYNIEICPESKFMDHCLLFNRYHSGYFIL